MDEKEPDNVGQHYIKKYYDRTITQADVQAFKGRMKGVHDYDVISGVRCPGCHNQLRWSVRFNGPICSSEDSSRACGWKPKPPKPETPRPPKKHTHGDTTVITLKP